MIESKLIGELAVRSTSRNKVLNPSIILVVFRIGAIEKHNRRAGEP